MFNIKNSTLKKLTALGLSAVIMSSSILPAFAADEISDGVAPVYDEAYYAVTDYYGNLTSGSVVKSYVTNGFNELIDFGEYDEINNLTDSTLPDAANGKVSFSFENTPSHFYFEGKTAKPFHALPWTMEVHYKLNGVATKAEDLAGQKGMIEIDIDVLPNPNASAYAKNNYTLEAMAAFNQDDILSLSAPGAQVQLIGNLRAVLFIAFPGEEQHFVIHVGSDNFSFGGMTFLMVPATLSQLDMISEIADKKEDIEKNYDKLSGSIDTLLNSLDGIRSGLYSTANGLDELNEAREMISTSKGAIYEQADSIMGDIDALNHSLDTLPGHIDKTDKLIDDTKKSLKKVDSAVDGIQDEVEDLEKTLTKLELSLSKIQSSGKASAADIRDLGLFTEELRSTSTPLMETLQELKLGIGSNELTMQGKSIDEVNASLNTAEIMDDTFQAVGDGDNLSFQQFAIAALMVNAAQNGQSMSAAEAGETLAALADTEATIKEVQQQLTAAMGADPGFSAAEDYYFSQAEEQVKAGAMAQGMDEATAAAYAHNFIYAATGKKAAFDSGLQQKNQLTSVFSACSTGTKMDEQHFMKALIAINYMKAGLSAPSAFTKAEEDSEALFTLFTKTNRLTQNAEKLTDLLGYNTSGVTSSLTSLLNNVSELCGNLIKVTDSLDDVTDEIDNVLKAMDDLYDVLDGNTEDLKNLLTETKKSIEVLQTTATDTNTFLGMFKSLLMKSGEKLDQGTKDTLTGLAATLRATAASLGNTGDVKSAKNNISEIIEDTWDDLTGEKNNLLLMDSSAPAESLTDIRNASPQSIQIVIRTQEIKEEKPAAETEAAVNTTEKIGFWGKLTQMFSDILSSITALFKK